MSTNFRFGLSAGVTGIALSNSTVDEESLKFPHDDVECVLGASNDVADNDLVVTGSSEGPSIVVCNDDSSSLDKSTFTSDRNELEDDITGRSSPLVDLGVDEVVTPLRSSSFPSG